MDEARRALTAEELLAGGDHRGAIAAAMDQYGARIFGYCVHNLKHRETAEDVLQNVFLQGYRDIGRLEEPRKLRSWLMSIAAHRVYDEIEGRKRHQGRVESDDDAVDSSIDVGAGPGEKLTGARLFEALKRCLAGLSQDVRATVLMRFYAQMSYEEMEVATKTKADTLNARVSRALPALRKCLEDKGWSHG